MIISDACCATCFADSRFIYRAFRRVRHDIDALDATPRYATFTTPIRLRFTLLIRRAAPRTARRAMRVRVATTP